MTTSDDGDPHDFRDDDEDPVTSLFDTIQTVKERKERQDRREKEESSHVRQYAAQVSGESPGTGATPVGSKMVWWIVGGIALAGSAVWMLLARINQTKFGAGRMEQASQDGLKKDTPIQVPSQAPARLGATSPFQAPAVPQQRPLSAPPVRAYQEETHPAERPAQEARPQVPDEQPEMVESLFESQAGAKPQKNKLPALPPEAFDAGDDQGDPDE